MRNYRTLLNTFAHINRFPVPHHFLDMPDYVFSTFVYFEYDFIINKNNNNITINIGFSIRPILCDVSRSLCILGF
jgi:hypothetical protein